MEVNPAIGIKILNLCDKDSIIIFIERITTCRHGSTSNSYSKIFIIFSIYFYYLSIEEKNRVLMNDN